MTALAGVSRNRPSSSRARFLQGVFAFVGRGLDQPYLIDPALAYVVPRDREAQLVYFRGGNSAPELVTAVVLRDGQPIRWFPMGAKGDVHVPLRIVEDLLAETRVELHLAAPAGVSGQVVIDLGLVEVG
jgi:assimilatory nitrate reductase catalytic subunit